MRRDRVSLDLRGLGAALRALAHERGVTVACAARDILVSELVRVELPRETAESETSETSNSTVKVTIRLPADDAREFRSGAQALGTSYGGYVRTLMRGPSQGPAANRKHALEHLTASTDQLAAACADINCLKRLLSGSDNVSTQAFLGTLRGLEREVREHLALASGVILELKPIVIRVGRTSSKQGNEQAAT